MCGGRTEPMLAPIRNILPDTGMIDFSPFVLMILLALVRRLVWQLMFGRSCDRGRRSGRWR